MDIQVRMAMIVMIIVLVVIAVGTIKNGRHWTDWLAAISCFMGAALIAYGLHIQCDNIAVFHRCG